MTIFMLSFFSRDCTYFNPARKFGVKLANEIFNLGSFLPSKNNSNGLGLDRMGRYCILPKRDKIRVWKDADKIIIINQC